LRFKLDENLPVELLTVLRDAGHDADSIRDEGLTGAPDFTILDRMKEEGRVLLTMDKGIGDLRSYRPEEYPGIVLFRPRSSGRTATAGFVRQHLPEVLAQALTGRLLVVSERGIRAR
jgi:predicted nuclease of predicted toxin-antitoxin system